MNATPLFLADGTQAKVSFCAECRIVHPSLEASEQCCTPKKCECGKDVKPYYTVCPECDRQNQADRELARFNAAEKIPAAGYDSWIFSDGHGDDDGYFPSLDYLQTWLEETFEAGDPERPVIPYVWACDEDQFAQVSADYVIDHICDNGYEGFDANLLEGVDELKAAMDAFSARNTHIVSYSPNYKCAIILNPSDF